VERILAAQPHQDADRHDCRNKQHRHHDRVDDLMEKEPELKPEPIERGQRSRPKYGKKGKGKPRAQPPFHMTVAEKRANAADSYAGRANGETEAAI
jgi:hypothetical protein